jgi:hypothetical protein
VVLVVAWVFLMASLADEHDTASAGAVWLVSGDVLEGVLGTVLPAEGHDTSSTGLDLMVLDFPGSEHIRLTAGDRLGNGAAS